MKRNRDCPLGTERREGLASISYNLKKKADKERYPKKKNPSQKDKNFNLKTSKMALLLHMGQQ